MKLGPLLLVAGFAGCAAVSSPQSYPPQSYPPIPSAASERIAWREGEPLMQGFFGVSSYDKVTREGGTTGDVEGDSGDLDELPVLGGGAQWKLGGDRMTYGLEGLFSLEGRANAEAFVIGGGGAAVAIDVDLLTVDVYGGPFVSIFLGEKLRAYAGAGPLFQFASYDQDLGTSDDSATGFGYGGYARAGLELVLPSATMIGVGGRWSSSTVDLSNDLGDLEIEGFQFLITVSRWL